MHVLIQEYRNHAGVDNIQTIDRYRAAISTQEDRITQLNAKVDLFLKILSDKKKPLTKVVATTPGVAITTAKEILKPIELTENSFDVKQKSSALKCLSCGKTLKKANTNYHCFPCYGGCGKIYSIGVDGSLTEKIKEPKYICHCGHPLRKYIKVEIDGFLHQTYHCNSKSGCDSYIQDRDGNFHLGRSKMALSRDVVLLETK